MATIKFFRGGIID